MPRRLARVASGFFVLLALYALQSALVARADYNRYTPTEPITIGDFVYDDDYQPSTTNCSTTVYSPSGAVVVGDALMTALPTGWHYYSLPASTTEGLWSASMYCGSTSTGDLIRQDKSFIIAANRLSDKTLDGGGSLATENYIDVATATLKTSIDLNSSLINSLNNISASDVWSFVGRDLDRPTIVAASTSAAVWNTAFNTLTGAGTIGKLIADNVDAKISTRSTSTLTAADVWSVANRTLTDYATSTVTQAIWSNANRTLTAYGNDITAADVWNVMASSLTVPNSIGKQIADNTDAQISTIPNLVWSAGTRTLTDYATSSVATAVWANPTRSLSTFGTLVADIWSDLTAPTRRLTSGSLTGGGNLVTENYLSTEITNVSTSLNAQILQNRSLISGLNNISAADVWAVGNRTLTDYATSSIVSAVWASPVRTLSTFGTLIADIWSDLTAPNRQLTTSSIAGGGVLATSGDVSSAIGGVTSSINAQINTASSTLAAQITAASNTLGSQINTASSSLNTQILQNRTLISNLNNISAADVWAAGSRTLTDYATSSISTAVWTSPVRTLTAFGTLIADIWSDLTAPNRQLTTSTIAGGGVLATNSSLSAYLDSATSSIITQVLQNRTLINGLNNISAASVWSYAGRDLDQPTTLVASTTDAVWAKAAASLTGAGTIGKLFVDNIDAKISSRGTSSLTAADVWDAGNRTLTDYSTTSIALGVWANAARTLTSGAGGGGLTAEDVWNVMTSTLTTVGSIGQLLALNVDSNVSTRASLSAQQAGWVVRMSDASSIAAGKTYRAKVYVYNNEAIATDANSLPTVSLYDADRNLVVNGVSMTKIATGTYEYTYVVANNASPGLWEAVAATEVTSNKYVQTNDFWVVEASPAQVIINSVTATSLAAISANVTISNEGLSGYEYHYEWCIVTSADNACGGGNDTFYASAAKFINPGDDWNTNLTGSVPLAGNYFFKLVVYFGTDHSSASRSFTATAATTNNGNTGNGGGGGGGGGGGAPPLIAPTTSSTTGAATTCTGADFNHDRKVNSVDFSILLAFWKAPPPWRNPCVDINHDRQVNSVEFSILMYEWGSVK